MTGRCPLRCGSMRLLLAASREPIRGAGSDKGRSRSELAQRLQMKVATVFVARSKVQRMLREEVGRLDRD